MIGESIMPIVTPKQQYAYQGAATVGTHLGSNPVAVRLPFVSECMPLW